VGERAKQRKRESGVVLHVVAPRDVPRREHALGEPLGRERKGRRRQDFERVLGNVVGGGRPDLLALDVE